MKKSFWFTKCWYIRCSRGKARGILYSAHPEVSVGRLCTGSNFNRNNVTK